MALKDLIFSDLYLGVSDAWISGVPGTSDPVATPPEDVPEVMKLREACDEYRAKNPEREDFPIRYADVSYRASVMTTIDEVVYVLRRLSEKIASIAELGIPPGFVEMMMRPKLTGLFIISGTFGQGKTTTASALLASRIGKYGGVAITVEEPPEMPLHGRHGEGVCYQTWVQRGGFGHACRQAARWAPSIIFLGEIRDSETALEALRASINGKLVICTAHADNPAMAIERIFALACADGSSPDDVLGMLASGLTAVIHQKLESTGSRRQLILDPLFMTAEDGQGARNIIRQRKFDQLKSIGQLQKNRMIVSGGKAIS
ncbi:ATPase, T2SS/T4P/T4SS family [Polaromonas aquatica]|uniref:ATPase, T2SS/T4P/T4SS family n=1 Tax=Polaromonas aquatica TaxID=332657 RepID=A0ABW1TWG9_9BURK